MNTIKVKRAELLHALKNNRAEHRAVFERACDGYRKQAIAQLEQMLSDAKAGKQIRRGLSLIEPSDQTRDYDRAIRMLEMSVDDEIEISEGEFAQYVMDDWSWKRQFTTTVQSYGAE